MRRPIGSSCVRGHKGFVLHKPEPPSTPGIAWKEIVEDLEETAKFAVQTETTINSQTTLGFLAKAQFTLIKALAILYRSH